MERIICLLLGYAFGLIQTGFIVGKIKGIDIREHGSKNAGTTNILRTMGLKYALIVFAGDALKCGAAILVTRLIYADSCSGIIMLLQLYTAAGVILGHNYPFYMNFKGGKGIAATAGLVIFSFGPTFTVLGLITFFCTFFITHYVSLGSLLVYVGLVAESLIFGYFGYFGFAPEVARNAYIEFNIVMFLLAVMAFARHKSNIKRLLSGNERKTYLKGKPEIDVDHKYGDGEKPSQDDLNPM